MARARQLLDRVRDDRRVRRDFERLIHESGLEGLGRDLREGPRRRRRAPQTGRWWLSRASLLLSAALVILASMVLMQPFPYDLPEPYQTAFVYARDGRPIAKIRPAEDRVVVPLERIPRVLRAAVIAAEDERFYDHVGVDPIAIARAAWENVSGGEFQGASTITQQLVKNLDYVGTERSIWRKVREAVTAIRMERAYSKDEILERYLNQIYFGESVFGVEAAAQHYFDRHVWRLTLPQAALLAGMIARPTDYSPRAQPEAALARRNWVIDRMVALGMIGEARAERARSIPLHVAAPAPQRSRAAYFVDYVRRYVTERYGGTDGRGPLYTGGLRIETTLDLRLQEAAERAIAGVLHARGDPSAALVSIDVDTGGILAMVGGRDFNESQVNLATGQGGTGRQAGSAFKPFVLATALKEGISQYEVYPAPSSASFPGWANVSNYGGASYGALSVHDATVNSVNTVYARLIMDVGPRDVVEVAHDMGIRSRLDAVGSLALGTSEVSPLEMASAYATLASGGIYRRPTAVTEIKSGDGAVLERIEPGGERAIPERVAREVTGILQDAVAYGTGSTASLPGVAVAGKTGTAESHADAWFCGYTREIATCVWVGHPRGRVPMNDVRGVTVTGGTFPAQIWRAFMEVAVPPGDHGARAVAGAPYDGSSTGATSSSSSYGPDVTEEPDEPTATVPPPPPEEPSPTPTVEPSPPDDGGDGIIPDIFPAP